MTVEFSGTRIKINGSFAALICLMLIFFEKRIVLISLFSSLCHETGHIIFMTAFSSAPEVITLGAFGMSIDRKNEIVCYKHEAIIAMGGIVINLFIVLICFLVYTFFSSQYLLEFAIVNLFIAAVNCVPVGILDFARALECVLLLKFQMKKAHRISDTVSVISSVTFVVFCIFYCAFINFNISLIAVMVYLVTSYKKRS